MMDGCQSTTLIALVLLSLALLISMCLNVIFCIRRRATLCRDTENCCSSHNYEGEGLTQEEGHYFHDLNHHEQQENPHNHQEQQENPIYGNITIDRRDVCYEMMNKQQTRDHMKPPEPDLNYASLDLKLAKKRKKHRHQQGQPQGRNTFQDQLPIHQNDFLEVEEDIDDCLPSRDTSTMVSHSSIYLNSQQIAQEAEEMEREKSANMERENEGWEEIRRNDVGSRKWRGEQESEERKDRQDDGSGAECSQLSEVHDTQSGTELFNNSFNNDSDQQH
ncbi:uncharacterized protein LOC113168866 [Anabas testudineus]|uniref:uncharacterized protein LOC113168866 n=1 Tax=Anabas testudineus TaxID=64144 RepID=UPI000E454731|nr:uncharacterized protein LOC113168866 [Anabas testudineus]